MIAFSFSSLRRTKAAGLLGFLFLVAPLALSAQQHFNGAKAMEYTREFVAIGPRWPTSPGHLRAEEFLRNAFKHDQLEDCLLYTSYCAAGSWFRSA